MWFLAIRYLTSRPKQTLLTLGGVVLGTAAYVAISGMMLGFQEFIINQLVNNDAHVKVTAREELVNTASVTEMLYDPLQTVFWSQPPSGRRNSNFIDHPQGWFERLDREPEVYGYSPQLSIQVIVNRAKISLGATFVGSNPERQIRVSTIDDYMVKGRFKDISSGGNRIIVADGLLEKLGAQVSETIFLSAGGGQSVPFKVVGSFHLGLKNIDETVIFGLLTDVQALNRSPSRISHIAVRFTDVAMARGFSEAWGQTSVDHVQSWDQANEGTLSVFKTQDIVRNSMTLSILIVAGFGIYNILNMAVNHKRREIAILRSMGYEPGQVSAIFFLQGVILGIMGGAIGLLVGYGACLYMSTIQTTAQRMFAGGRMLVSFDSLIYVKAILIAVFSTTFASYLPSRSAGKMTPIEIIRSGG